MIRLDGALLGVVLLTGCATQQEHLPIAVPAAAVLAPSAVSGADFAAAACTGVRLVQQGITAGAAADSVRRDLAGARVVAAEAARRDPRYQSLSGGVAALDEALRVDDGPTARLAMLVARANCPGG